ncbi:helix-turn-helix domain-containing protein [Desulfonatronovibrio magnus]|uniref:helix-turn-helix domain-containing protein n=1 Tax=Desulfonatronovibrio magnus TaxID=698827 RepID=UPI0005EB62A0|nr:helix-turn-helix domain-containing protein [Desulfonatronovibrio magnus]
MKNRLPPLCLQSGKASVNIPDLMDIKKTYNRTLSDHLIQNGLDYSNLNISDNIKLCEDDTYVELYFPHIFLYEIYKDQIQNDAEYFFNKKIIHNVNNNGSYDIKKLITDNKDVNYKFENFLKNEKNHIAYNICLDICKNRYKKNFITLYGTKKTGKTHLCHAIINKLKNKNIMYIDADDICSEFKIEKINISKKILKYDIVIIENINKFHNNNKCQIIFKKVVDNFLSKDKILILTYQGEFIDENIYENDLYTRIMSSMTAKLNTPGLNDKVEFAKKFCQENKIRLGMDIIFTISKSSDTFCSLRGVLEKLKFSRDNQGRIDPQAARKLEENNCTTNIKSKEILNTVSNFMDISCIDILSKKRDKKITLARQICMFLIKKVLDWPYCKIGESMGGRSHSTVIYSIKKIEKLQTVNQDINKMVNDLFVRVTKSNL